MNWWMALPWVFFYSSHYCNRISLYPFLSWRPLGWIISLLADRNLLSGFSVGTWSEEDLLFHLFTDDTLILREARLEHPWSLHCMLLCFEVASGLKINFTKSKILPVGNVDNVGCLVSILGWKESSLPVAYLGLPLGAHFKVKSIWEGILDRLGNQLVWRDCIYRREAE